MTTIKTLTTPTGTRGLACSPWSAQEIYAVAANWAQASAPIYYWGDGDWVPWKYQVADFCHDPEAALAAYLDECISESGTPCDDDGDTLAADAVGIAD